ncbi:MAG: ATP-binding protein [Saprospiraceae bacterium]|nr:MAG: ATP-binding protein [Saprospiraceae bacterium]
MLKLASKQGSVSKVEPYVEQLVSRYNLEPDKKCNILVSLTEAVTNAIVHGNGMEEGKTVKVKTKRESDCLALRVSDEGRGFDVNDLSDPTTPDHIAECGGRGVFLMRQLSDNIRFYNNGSTVEMRFKL